MSWIRRETEKGAVQYICPHCHDYHEFREDFGGRTFSENYIFCRRCGARNGTGNAPTLTPPNEPLTLDELREMDGEPVWVKCLKPSQYTDPPVRWRILDKSITGSFGVWNGDSALIERTYGVDWLAYRRLPEGET